MGKAIGDILPLALGVAISPIPVVAVIVMLSSKRGLAKGLSFVLGWLLGGAVLGTVILVLAGGRQYSSGSDPATGMAAFKLALGAFLLLRALQRRRGAGALAARRRGAATVPAGSSDAAGSPADATPPSAGTGHEPRWLQAADHMGVVKGGGLGAALAAINPKNLVLTAAAAASIAQAQLSGGQAAGTLAIYVVITALGVGAPVVVALAMGGRAESLLARWRVALVEHNDAVMTVLLVVFGVLLVGKGIAGLSA